MIPIAGFAPDADPTTPGVLTDCDGLIPTNIGMAGAPSLVSPDEAPALAAACKGAGIITKLDGSRRIFAGTAAAIYELASGSWTDRSAVGGYTGGADTQWSIAQFGDSTLMSNGVEAIQKSTTAAFAAIAGAPIAEIVFSVGAFVMALNVNDGASKPDGWHCCAAYDETDWAEAVSTQSASGRLVSTPGELTAGGRLGEYAVAYKAKSLFLGQYVGPPSVWDWRQVPGGEAGCVGKKAWCDLDGRHFFVGDDNFWLFDGAQPIQLGNGVLRDWFSTECSASYKYKTECHYDKTNGLVWIFYPSTASSTLDRALVYHVNTKRWGRVTVSIETALEYITSSVTIDDLDDYAATIDALPAISFDSPYWSTSARAPAVVNTSHQIQTFTGPSSSSSLTTGDVGDDYTFSTLQRVKLRFTTAPTSATLQHYYKNDSGDSYTAGNLVTMSGHKFDLLWSARWHQAKVNFVGSVEVTGIDAQYDADGTE